MKKTVLFVLILTIVWGSVAGATVLDTEAPYFGDYLFVYNGTDSNISLSPKVSAVLQNRILQSTVDELPEETEQLQWTPDYSSLTLPADLEQMPNVNRLEAPILYASNVQTGATYTYLVCNPRTGSYYYQNFICQATGKYCNVLVEPNADGQAKISASDAGKLVSEFDSNIQPFMVENFGNYYTYMGTDSSGRYLQVSQNTKMDILLYDIQDGYNGTTVRSYVGGYTDLTDFIGENLGGNGNERGILHIDIYPLMGTGNTPNIEKCYSTIVHEFQHQISYSDSLFDYFTGKTDFYVNDAWWNEAFSMAAEHLYTGEPLAYRINSYNQAGDSVPLTTGLVLDYLDYSENDNNIPSNYSTAYLFGQYLRCQTKHLAGGGNQIYRAVLEEVGTDYTAILSALSSIGYEHTPDTFEELYRNFRMATILKNETGPYGFYGESTFQNLVDHAYTGTLSLTLKPGAAAVLKNPKNYTASEDGLSYTAFSTRCDFTYDLNLVSDTVINVTHGDLPACGVTLLVAGYDGEWRLLGTDHIEISQDTENYPYALPKGSEMKKFFLFAGDGSFRPLSYAEME